MSESITTDDDFTRSAGRQLAIYALIAVGGVAALMWALSIAASFTSSGAQTTGAVDAATQSITIAFTEEPPQLDSTLATDQSSGMVLAHVMEGLLRYDTHNEIAPGVAERWEITPEGATFWLRPDARWSDGAPVTAHDFEFAWKLALDPKRASEYAFIFYPIRNAEAANRGDVPLAEVGVRACGSSRTGRRRRTTRACPRCRAT
jgi:oligopeptide transport system substrate-binding protein